MAPASDIVKLRNIGIIAHIDAGKTTTTERILYYTGETHRMGDVDDGTTKTDFLPTEQERGITIRAAAVTCRWKDVRINLIDTPGHVDFTAEVERSLRVLDGGVVVFSGMEGVEAQSETVWHQADRYRVPRLCFINKLDRIGADFYRVFDEFDVRLQAKPAALQLPIGKEKEFRGVADLITRKAYYFDESSSGKDVIVKELPADLVDDVELWRETLIEKLADTDDAVAEAFLEGGEISEELIRAAIRRATIALAIQPVLCGSSLKYIGVQPLLDAVALYLPSPLDVPPVSGENPVTSKTELRPPDPEKPFCGLLFKIQADEHGELGFVRIYSGELKASTRVLNAGRDRKENITRLWHIQADKRIKVDVAYAGDIVGVVGLQQSITGDTLTDAKHPIVLEKITFPNTVVSMSIEPDSSADKEKLASTLALMQKEDPTFKCRISEETGETLISGMGELHLEIITERIAKDFHVKIRTGKPRVSYRETIKGKTQAVGECDRQTAAGPLFARMTVALEPIGRRHDQTGEHATFLFVNRCPTDAVPKQLLAIVEEALREECLAGGLAGYPLQDIRATLLAVEFREPDTNEQALRIAVANAVRHALDQVGVDILEPIMKLDVATPEEYLGEITADLGARGAMIEGIGMRGPFRVVTARVPLRQMFGYTTAMRSLSQGRASSSMEPLDYAIVPPDVSKTMF